MRDQLTTRICLAEIERCRKTTRRPNLLLLLADRPGWRPLPVEIPVIEFEAIRKHLRVDDPQACRLLVEWYRRDDNAAPPVYLLQPRAGSFAQRERWMPIEDSLRTALIRGISTLSLSPEARLKYVASVTELEARAGLRKGPGDRQADWAICFLRSLTAAPGDAAVSADRERDRRARGRLFALKRMVRSVVPAVVEYEATSTAHRSTRGHIPRFRSEAYRQLASVIRSEIEREDRSDPLQLEVEAHRASGEARARAFVGRQAALAALGRYVTGESVSPFVVTGPAGGGKSSLLGWAFAFCGTVPPRRHDARTVCGGDAGVDRGSVVARFAPTGDRQGLWIRPSSAASGVGTARG